MSLEEPDFYDPAPAGFWKSKKGKGIRSALNKRWGAGKWGKGGKKTSSIRSPTKTKTKTITVRRFDVGTKQKVKKRGKTGRRRYDVPSLFRGIVGKALMPILVTVGGIAHNVAVRRGYGAKVYQVGGVGVTQAGGVGGIAGVIIDYYLNNNTGQAVNLIGAGAFSEGVAVPAIEGGVKLGVSTGQGLQGEYIPPQM